MKITLSHGTLSDEARRALVSHTRRTGDILSMRVGSSPPIGTGAILPGYAMSAPRLARSRDLVASRE
jgi:hypothetical protein